MFNNGSDNLMEKLAGRLANIVLLGFFCVLFSIPIITAGASFTALNSAMKSHLYDDNDKPLKLFLSVFKEKFGLSTKVWALHLLAIAVLVWDFVYYRVGESTLDTLASAGIFVLICFLAFEVLMVFVVISQGMNKKVFGVIKTALDLSFTCVKESLMILVITSTVILTSIFLFRGLIPFVPGIISYLSWQIIPQMLKKYKFKIR